MGSDMIVAFAKAPRFNAAAQRLIDTIVREREVTIKILGVESVIRSDEMYAQILTTIGRARAARIGHLSASDFEWHDDYLYDDPEHVYPQAQLHRWLDQAIENVLRSREVSWVSPYGLAMLVTGGPSWGDSPTEIYDELVLIGNLGIFDRIITVGELRAALWSLEKPQPVIEE